MITNLDIIDVKKLENKYNIKYRLGGLKNMGNEIVVQSKNIYSGKSGEELQTRLNQLSELKKTEKSYLNTEASMVNIISGCIGYFDKLDSDFLGKANYEGIPDAQTDHFASNLYRLNNSIKSLSEFWKIPISFSEEFKVLLDIRTFIVHSGECISKIESINLKKFKDSQLGFIRKVSESPFTKLRLPKNIESDYVITIWSDKHDSKKRNENDVDYNIRMQNFKDTDFFLKASDVRKIVMLEIQNFLFFNEILQAKPIKKNILPPIKDSVINPSSNDIDFDKLANLISKSKRGGYIIERGLSYWGGYGLERLMNYSQAQIINPLISEKEVYIFIVNKIKEVISLFWNEYQDNNIPDDKIISLDIRKVFSKLIPDYEYKNYLHQKMFTGIAPYFNTKESDDNSDVDYLIKLIAAFDNSFDISLRLENTVDGLVCDYFCEAIKIGLEKNN